MKVNHRIWNQHITTIETAVSAAINRIAPVSIHDAQIARRIVRRQQIAAYFRNDSADCRPLVASLRTFGASRHPGVTRQIFDSRA